MEEICKKWDQKASTQSNFNGKHFISSNKFLKLDACFDKEDIGVFVPSYKISNLLWLNSNKALSGLSNINKIRCNRINYNTPNSQKSLRYFFLSSFCVTVSFNNRSLSAKIDYAGIMFTKLGMPIKIDNKGSYKIVYCFFKINATVYPKWIWINASIDMYMR